MSELALQGIFYSKKVFLSAKTSLSKNGLQSTYLKVQKLGFIAI